MTCDIILEDICVDRGGKEIIHNTNARMRAGKTTVFMGPSGCGKSTLLKVASGITPPDRGRVYINGKNFYSLPEREATPLRRQLGFVFQDAALWANKSILQNLTLPLLYHDADITMEDAAARAEQRVRATGYGDELTLRPSQLSSGEMKMVSFARALISDPSVLFLDSPFLSVDHTSVEKMRKIIDNLLRAGGTLCAIFQDPKYIARRADELLVMKDGRIIAAGPFADIIHTTDVKVQSILGELLDQAASYDGSILDILSDSGDDPFHNGTESG